MGKWFKKFEKIIDYKLSLSPIREVDDIDIYMDAEEYHSFVGEINDNSVTSHAASFPNNFDIDTLMYMGVKFLIHKIETI